jgi:hypothetical protein
LFLKKFSSVFLDTHPTAGGTLIFKIIRASMERNSNIVLALSLSLSFRLPLQDPHHYNNLRVF